MKLRLFVLLISTFFLWQCRRPARMTEMHFERMQQTSFEALKQQAAKAGKPIFVDVYAVWCGPCKYMDKNVFTSPLVAEKFNRELLSYKVNGEDADGVKFVNQYKVNAYPTFLFLKPDGEVLLRLDGVFTPEMLVSEAEFALKLYKEK